MTVDQAQIVTLYGLWCADLHLRAASIASMEAGGTHERAALLNCLEMEGKLIWELVDSSIKKLMGGNYDDVIAKLQRASINVETIMAGARALARHPDRLGATGQECLEQASISRAKTLTNLCVVLRQMSEHEANPLSR